MALILKRRGIDRVRPLAGGYHGWRDLGYPIEARERVLAAKA